MKRNATLIICLGNPLMRDEGIGIRLVADLEARLQGREDVDVQDMATGGLSVLHAITNRSKVIFVDCAFMDAEPGTIQKFRPEEAVSKKIGTRQSMHEGDLFNTLEWSRQLDEYPEDVVIFGIQPKVVEDGQGLSPELEEKIDEYVDAILCELDGEEKG